MPTSAARSSASSQMVDGATLLIDHAEGPMQQTTFVRSRALGRGLRPIVVAKGIDRPPGRAVPSPTRPSTRSRRLAQAGRSSTSRPFPQAAVPAMPASTSAFPMARSRPASRRWWRMCCRGLPPRGAVPPSRLAARPRPLGRVLTGRLRPDTPVPPASGIRRRVNDRPLAGRKGGTLSSRASRDRLRRAAEGKVEIRVAETDEAGGFRRPPAARFSPASSSRRSSSRRCGAKASSWPSAARR